MPDCPEAPCFVHTPNTAEFWLKEPPLDQQPVNPLSLARGWPERALIFDAAGEVWSMVVPGASRYRKWYWLILAQFYNPLRLTGIWWKPLRSYDLSELLTVFRRQVSIDEDCLTQFYEPEQIYQMLDQSRSFGDVLAVWHKIGCEPEDIGKPL